MASFCHRATVPGWKCVCASLCPTCVSQTFFIQPFMTHKANCYQNPEAVASFVPRNVVMIASLHNTVPLKTSLHILFPSVLIFFQKRWTISTRSNVEIIVDCNYLIEFFALCICASLVFKSLLRHTQHSWWLKPRAVAWLKPHAVACATVAWTNRVISPRIRMLPLDNVKSNHCRTICHYHQLGVTIQLFRIAQYATAKLCYESLLYVGNMQHCLWLSLATAATYASEPRTFLCFTINDEISFKKRRDLRRR